MPAISVIIPVYRVERYLDACVSSVLAQTFGDFEIILVDDGSPDGCPALCDAWVRKDPRIRVIHRENGGLSAARNTGIEAAKGQFLAFVDSDDLLEPDTLRRAYEAQRQHDADLVVFNLCFADENGKVHHIDFNSRQIIDRKLNIDLAVFGHKRLLVEQSIQRSVMRVDQQNAICLRCP